MPSPIQLSITTALQRLPSKFAKASESGALYFFNSTTQEIENKDLSGKFQIRLCPALLNKEKAKKEVKNGKETEGQEDKSSKLPFQPPYVEDLHVGDLENVEGEEGMAMLLNKYSVIPQHFLLCSKTQQSQSSPPSPSQLLLAYLTLLTSEKQQKTRLLAFYNGGPGAGASQSWRHLQCIPLSGFEEPPYPFENELESQIERRDKPFVLATAPYLHLVHKLESGFKVQSEWTQGALDGVEMMLAKAMTGLLDCMVEALRRNDSPTDRGWNILMTTKHLHLIPRSQPSYPLPQGDVLEVNALGYAGMLLVKSEQQLEALKQATSNSDPSVEQDEAKNLLKVLEHCGVPRTWGEWEEPTEGALAQL